MDEKFGLNLFFDSRIFSFRCKSSDATYDDLACPLIAAMERATESAFFSCSDIFSKRSFRVLADRDFASSVFIADAIFMRSAADFVLICAILVERDFSLASGVFSRS